MAKIQDTHPCRFSRLLEMRILMLIGFAALTIGVNIPSARADDQTIDPSQLKLTFDEEFKTLSISPWGPGTRWIAHTPWAGDFGNARFDNPGPHGPFTLTSEGLQITAKQDAKGKWHAGLISSMDSIGPHQTGFAQEYGYFEMSAKLPSGAGVWPAFWLIGTDRTFGTAEFDVMEFYGHDPTHFISTVHFWGKYHNTYGFHHVVKVASGLLSSQFNTYGVLITPVVMKVYFDRQEVWATPTLPEFRMPMYVLANLALGGGWPIKKLQSPQVMDIQYIRVYQAP
jgi:beta-glucanase (GH16 family)